MAPLSLEVSPSSSSPTVYQLSCSVCKGEFSRKTEWLNHLCEEDHQKLARKQWMEEWNQNLKESCLIVFTAKPLTSVTAKEILEYFGGEVSAPLIDFVWWGDRGKIGILRFENREKVKQVRCALKCWGSKKIKLDSLRIVVKAGFKQNTMEWGALFPEAREEKEEEEPPQKKKKKKKKKALEPLNLQDDPPNDIENQHSSSEPSSPNPPAGVVSQPIKEPAAIFISLTDTDSDQNNSSDHDNDDPCPSKMVKHSANPSNQIKINTASTSSYLRSTQCPSSSLTRTSHPLQFEYCAIQTATLIPDTLYDQGMKAITSLKKILSLLYFKLEVAMFRNWVLKLKHPSITSTSEEDDLLVYVYHADPDPNSNLNQGALDTKLRVYLSEKDNQITDDFQLLENSSDKLRLKHVSTNVKITVVTPKTSKEFLEEVQLCRLMEYMCQFDPRAHGLITLVCYWVGLNDIEISDKEDGDNRQSYKTLHSKYTVPWLVLFFMCKGKMIPSVRKILERNPDKFLRSSGNFMEVSSEIGYYGDQSYVEEWRASRLAGMEADEKSEEFILELLKVFKKFVTFCEMDLGKAEHDLILSTSDGKLVSILERMRAQRDEQVKMKEINGVKKMEEEIRMERRIRGNGDGGTKIYKMTHPFLWDWGFSMSKELGASLQVAELVKMRTWKADGFWER